MTPLRITHVPDSYRCHQTDHLSFFTCLTVSPETTIEDEVTVKVYISSGAKIDECWAPTIHGDKRFYQTNNPPDQLTPSGETQYQVVFWRFSGANLEAGGVYEYEVKVVVSSTQELLALRSAAPSGPQNYEPVILKSWAEVAIATEERSYQSEIIAIEVRLKAESMKYLPGIYHEEEQELLWRYLMAFDNYWAMVEDRLSNFPAYFDPYLAPSDFLPWLASWVGLVWDKRLPEPRRQNLIPAMVDLYQRRGTKEGLRRYLQICIGLTDAAEAKRRIEIIENPIGNFVLGDEEIELGSDLIMGEMESERCKFSVTMDWTNLENKLDEGLLREIIENWKPAHTIYELYY